MDQEALVGQIEAAYPSIALEAGISLRQALLDDDWEDSPEALRSARAEDVVDDWKNIPDSDLEEAFLACSVFTYLDDAGYRFYLPAALRLAVRDPFGECAFITCLHLLPAKESRNDWTPRSVVEWLRLTEAQATCISSVLAYLEAVHRESGEKFLVSDERCVRGIQEWKQSYGA